MAIVCSTVSLVKISVIYTGTVSTNIASTARSKVMCNHVKKTAYLPNLRSQSPTNCLLVLRKMWHLFALDLEILNRTQSCQASAPIFQGRGVDIFDDHLELWSSPGSHTARSCQCWSNSAASSWNVGVRPKCFRNQKRCSKRPRKPAMCRLLSGKGSRISMSKKIGAPLGVTERPSKWDILHRDGPTSPFKKDPTSPHPVGPKETPPTASFMPRYMSVWRSSIVLLVLHVGQGLHQKKSSGPVTIWI